MVFHPDLSGASTCAEIQSQAFWKGEMMALKTPDMAPAIEPATPANHPPIWLHLAENPRHRGPDGRGDEVVDGAPHPGDEPDNGGEHAGDGGEKWRRMKLTAAMMGAERHS